MDRIWMREPRAGARVVGHLTRLALFIVVAGASSAGCTRLELEHKATAYNAAIAESTNEAILLNAVRASQRAPMSFTGLGDLAAQPSVSGAASSTINFDPFGLTTYSVNPSVNVNGGFTQFGLTNLNQTEFIGKIQKPVDTGLISYFVSLHWPEELLAMMFISEYRVSSFGFHAIQRQAEDVCKTRSDARIQQICDVLTANQNELAAAQCHPYDRGPIITILNTAREACGMLKFQVFMRTVRLLNLGFFRGKHYTTTSRSAQGMLYYLGELIAAQNYSPKAYVPQTLVGTPAGRKLVPFFVVHRGLAAPGQAAVSVSYAGDVFYIPRPELGTYEEARSLQVLDFVTQVIAAQTASKDLPKSNTIGLVSIR